MDETKVQKQEYKPNYEYLYVLNKKNIKKSTECACLCCFTKFKPEEINGWGGDFGDKSYLQFESAICPYCNEDYVIPNYLLNYTDELLVKMHDEIFRRK